MIPDSWFPATRPDDGETVGYLDMVGEEFQPYDLLGRPHGEPAEYTEAEERLAELGLSYLARRWSFEVQDHPEPIAVVISELNRDAVVVLSDDADYHRDFGTPFSVPLPLDGSVLWENPDGSGPRFTQSVPNR